MGGLVSIPEVRIDWNKNMKGQTREEVAKRDAEEAWSTKGWVAYYTFCSAFNALLVGVIFARITEIISMVTQSSIYVALVFILISTSVSLLVAPASTWKKTMRRFIVISVLMRTIKVDMDTELGKGKISKHVAEGGVYDLEGKVALVTGANSGIGYGTTKLLASYGAAVVMACRSMSKCNEAKTAIERELSSKVHFVGPVVPMQMDLSDLLSVKAFVAQFKRDFKRLDFLINNAGAIPSPGLRTKQGIELSIGAMHFGHFALTKWLMPVMRKSPRLEGEGEYVVPLHGKGTAKYDLPKRQEARRLAQERASKSGSQYVSGSFYDDGAARVIFTSSDAMNFGAFHSSLLYGDSGYDSKKVEGTGKGDFHGEHTDNCGLCNPLATMFGSSVGSLLAFIPPFIPCCPIGKCPHTNSYARSKLANVLMAQELQSRYDGYAYGKGGARKGVRRIVTASIHPGTVQANIHEVFSNPWTNWFMRSAEEAARIIIYATLENNFLPGSFIDSMSRPGDMTDWAQASHGLEVHAEAFPDVKKLQWFAEAKNSRHSPPQILQKSLWQSRTLMFPPPVMRESRQEDIDREKKEFREMVSARLWDVSEAAVKAFERKEEMFSRGVSQSSSSSIFDLD